MFIDKRNKCIVVDSQAQSLEVTYSTHRSVVRRSVFERAPDRSLLVEFVLRLPKIIFLSHRHIVSFFCNYNSHPNQIYIS